MSKKQAFLVYISLVLIWSINWTVIKLILETVPVFWTTALRYGIASVTLIIVLLFMKKISIPHKHDLAGIFVIGIVQMVIMGVFMNVGLNLTSVGRSAILTYSMPLWITPIAFFYLREKIHRLQFIGVLLGLGGIFILFSPFSPRSNVNELIGSGFLLTSSFLWAMVIVFIKKYTWKSTPLQLSLWQNLLAASITGALAFTFEGVPTFSLTPTLIWQLLFLGVLATAVAFWASTVISQYLPAVVNSLGLLAVPIASMIISTLYLGEEFDLPLIIATTLIIGGIILGFLPSLKIKK